MTDNGVKPSTIRKRIDAHRRAVQSADPEATRATWDKLEDYIGSVFSLSPKDKITDPDENISLVIDCLEDDARIGSISNLDPSASDALVRVLRTAAANLAILGCHPSVEHTAAARRAREISDKINGDEIQ